MYGRSLAGADPDALIQRFATDCFTTMTNSQSGSFEVEIGSTGTEAIRRYHTYPPSDDDVLFAAVHKAGKHRILLRPGASLIKTLTTVNAYRALQST